MTDTTRRTVAYTAEELDGVIHRVTAENGTWNDDIARQFAAYDLQDRYNGRLPVDDVNDIDILDIREVED